VLPPAPVPPLLSSLSTRRSLFPRWVSLLFVLVAATLLGSVLVPAGETTRVLELLDDDEHLIEPARLITARIESGIARESSELQRFAASGDATSLRRLRIAVAENERDLLTLREVSARLDSASGPFAIRLSGLMQHWRSLNGVAARERPLAASLVDSAAAREAVRDSIVVALSGIRSDLDDRAAQRRAAVRAHERRGLFVNAALVLAALVAMAAVFEAMQRERRGARGEAALRVAAESLAAAFTLDDVARQLARSALDLLHGRTACVGHVDRRDGGDPTISSQATAGADVPGCHDASLFHGSVAERAIARGAPLLVGIDSRAASTSIWSGADGGRRAVVVPLGRPESPIGAVFVSAAPSRRFRREDVNRADILGHLASLAYEKVRLLDESREARNRLERVMDSRSRLMRGFSHDVKNPLGAADGYAALLADGIYGEITTEQRLKIDRVRQSIQRALSLIDDLHELARAETGNLAVKMATTDLTELVRAMGEEYRAAADAKQLRLVVDVDPELRAVQTDQSRIRQIVANLLSNAIKYTDHGSVVLRGGWNVGDEASGGAYAFISVADTGPGVPLDKREFIFEEFGRLAADRQPGAGLGLAISKRVADALGCRIRVEGEVGGGSTFTLCIPLAVAQDRDDGRLPEAPASNLGKAVS